MSAAKTGQIEVPQSTTGLSDTVPNTPKSGGTTTRIVTDGFHKEGVVNTSWNSDNISSPVQPPFEYDIQYETGGAVEPVIEAEGVPTDIKTKPEGNLEARAPDQPLPQSTTFPLDQPGGIGAHGTRGLGPHQPGSPSGSYNKVTPWGTHDSETGTGSPSIAKRIEEALDKAGEKIKRTLSGTTGGVSTPRGTGTHQSWQEKVTSSFKSLVPSSPRFGSSGQGSPTAAFKQFANKYFGNSNRNSTHGNVGTRPGANPTSSVERAIEPLTKCCGGAIPVAA